MKGYLNVIILKMLSHHEMSGEDIVKEIERRRGKRPSPGTIYPILKIYVKNGWIREVPGCTKIKLYKITPKGKKEIHTATKHIIMMFSEFTDDFRKCKC